MDLLPTQEEELTMHLKNRVGAAALAAGVALTGVAAATATIAPGTPAKDVHRGLDNDNADNPFIQPPGVVAKQHMDNTDVLFGRDNDDLLIGRLGGDTAIGGDGSDILIGGPEGFAAPNSDVLLGDRGHDINVWFPGDGSDAYVGDKGYDSMIFAPPVTKPSGALRLVPRHGRIVPRVDIGGQPQLSCDVVPIPASQRLGAQFLVRFLVAGNITVTVRQKDVEQVLCPSPLPGRAKVADLTRANPKFHNVRLNYINGTVGDIVAAP